MPGDGARYGECICPACGMDSGEVWRERERLVKLEAQLAARDRDVAALVRTLESVSKREDELEALLRETLTAHIPFGAALRRKITAALGADHE